MISKIRKNLLLLIPTISLLFFCSHDHEKLYSINKFNDPIIYKINEQKFNRWKSHLLKCLDYPQAQYKTETILAFASLRDVSPLEKVMELVQTSKSSTVRSTAAFFLGESSSKKSIPILYKALQDESDSETQKQLLIALSKKIQPNQLFMVTEFSPKDSISEEGYLLSLFILRERMIYNSNLGNIAMLYSKDLQKKTGNRKLSSFLLTLCDSTLIEHQEEKIKQLLIGETSPDIVSNLLITLSRLKKEHNGMLFETSFKSKNWRVRMIALECIYENGNRNYTQAFYQALKDSVLQVRRAASEILASQAQVSQNFEFLREAREQTDWQTKLNLYEGAFLKSKDTAILDEVFKLYDKTENRFEKEACIKILGLSRSTYKKIKEVIFSTPDPLIRTTCAKILGSFNIKRSFPRELDREFINIYIKGIASGDPGVVSIFSKILSDPFLRYYELIEDTALLYSIRDELKDKQEFTALEAINKLIFKIDSTQIIEARIPILKPDWDAIKLIDRNQKILIKTSKGDIIVKLCVEKSPVAVSNFVSLIRNDYYSNTVINMARGNIIQSGCKRGDGFGRKPYLVPFEVGINSFNSPTLNMVPAKSGLESTQWYISINPVEVNLGASLPIGIVETDTNLLQTIETGDTVISITLL